MTYVDTRCKIWYNIPTKKNECSHYGGDTMNCRQRILEMLDHITSPSLLDKIYWYVQRILLRE